MRIHFYGNILNWAYQFGKYFRAQGHEVLVFLQRQEPNRVYTPQWEDEYLQAGLPDWVEVVDASRKRLLAPGKTEKEFIKRLGDCDLIQAFGEYALWAWRTGTPYVILSYGGDLEIIPFYRKTIKGVILSILLKKAFQKASFFVYAIPSHKALTRKLALHNVVFNPYAVPIEAEKYAPLPGSERLALRNRYPHEFVFFHGSRQEWTFKDANDKANDRLFKAFARFLKDGCANSLLIAAERGRDIETSKQLVAHLGITSQVMWVKELRKSEVIRMLNSVDAFFDQFSHGYYGVAALEALSCGVPTFVYINRAHTDGIDLPPVVNVCTEEEIFLGMKEFADREKGYGLRKASRDWVLQKHQWGQVGNWYLKLYENTLNRDRHG